MIIKFKSIYFAGLRGFDNDKDLRNDISNYQIIHEPVENNTAAIAAKLVYPKKTVISFNGDGCFMMLGQEIINAVENKLNPIFIIINNKKLGTIRMHQERNFPKRTIGTDILNPDFVALANAYGLDAYSVTKTEEFANIFEKAKMNQNATLIELVIEPNVLGPTLEIGKNI